MFDLDTISFHSSQNMNSNTGEDAKADTFRGLGMLTSIWKTTKKVRILHLAEEGIKAVVVFTDHVGSQCG